MDKISHCGFNSSGSQVNPIGPVEVQPVTSALAEESMRFDQSFCRESKRFIVDWMGALMTAENAARSRLVGQTLNRSSGRSQNSLGVCDERSHTAGGIAVRS